MKNKPTSQKARSLSLKISVIIPVTTTKNEASGIAIKDLIRIISFIVRFQELI